MNPYVPILFFFFLGIAFAAFSVFGFQLLGPKRYNAAKLQSYECGIQPSPHAEQGGRVPVKFYTTAMLFIIFDVEVLFMFPFVVAFDQLGLFALIEIVLFVASILITYVFIWRRGGLEWD
ncbi:NAD(P)H-quinone oxidoreductase subunit 3 [Dermatophilus congolensis]|uniref:NADH-quinone oxidoreductase subunit n=1 Tax=Dermatophilus congolensis TaxID=1863 RepID=A0A239VT10_9MICO|nr:NADH-quinone oxidoreductase subunit A [Dermatophilus congolensis]SNV24838.1 NAD(P)H-quinone oxidoreductase subunit 3 [Dermatophilus congolensis]